LAARAGISNVDEFIAALTAGAKAAGLAWPSRQSRSSVDEVLANLVTSRPVRPVLVIDDAENLPEDVLTLVTRIVASARDSLTSIIVSRSRSAIPVARLRALGFLQEVGIDDLRFSLPEIIKFMALNGVGPVDAAMLQKLHDDTKGWIAGIAIAHTLSCREWMTDDVSSPRPPTALWRAYADYFGEEVMAQQPLAIRNFIVDTAVLEEMTPAACAAVTGLEDSRRMLGKVEEAGLFVEMVDVETCSYRYHPLFRSLILRRLYDRDPARAKRLHVRASCHFADSGDPVRAIAHAERAHDPEFLTDQLDSLAEPLIYCGYLYRIDELATNLPWSLMAERPNLLLALAWRRIRGLAFKSAEKLIAAAESYIAKGLDEGILSECKAVHLRQIIEHRLIMLDAARDDMPKVERRAESLLAEFGDDEPYLSCSLLAQLMAARRELYHFHDILRLEAETRKALSRPGSDFASIALKASVAPTLMVQGKVSTAKRMLEESLALARSIQGNGSGLAALPALPLAELCYDCGDLERARELVDGHMGLARQWGFVDQLSAGYLVRARLLAADGDTNRALNELNEAQLVALECGLDRLRAFAIAEQVRILIKKGQPKEAQAAFVAGGIEPDAEPFPTLSPTRGHESIAIAWLRLEMQTYRLTRARKVAKRWSEFVRHNGAVRSAVAFELLLAEIAILDGDRSEARRAVREAVGRAAAAGWTQIFVDEGDPIGSLIVEAYGQGPVPESAVDQFAARLVAEFRGSPNVDADEEYGLGSKLVSRELEILGMVSAGLRNREIGDRVGLTEGTVKWYMQQIYDKLGVRRRPQAVMRAKQLGLLA
ncbi:MAG: helix-turn-helix transcriptional regulator, partial [Alphaproteobacteria bacterium]|nr:helix-turn-helix transcriptional regulator [Alphaproteobacteria bacterium]